MDLARLGSHTALALALLFGGLNPALLISLTLIRCPEIWAGRFGLDLFSTAAKLVGAAIPGFLVFQWFRQTWTWLETPKWDGPGKPLLFPGRTTHSRMFPNKHSFSYSYLVVGVPVGWEGNAGGMLSAGAKSEHGLSSWFSLTPRLHKGWYNVDPADYLARGESKLGLRGKLDDYLRAEGANPADYPYAYLITAARFLGHHFNPVSFWYLYDSNKSLAAMILEVNNTFDERRMYLLTPGDDSDKPITNDTTPPPRTVLKHSWPKDFHVSPFNSRKGAYSLMASDPLRPRMEGTGPINNTINLISSKGHGKLVARLFPEGPAIDPSAMTWFEKVKFLVSWWWVGFVTFPRILKEAGALFFRRKLHVWFRPEPLKENIGRNADASERILEPIFRRYLQYLVEQSSYPLALKYIPGGIPDTSSLFLSPSAKSGDQDVETLELRVLTPVFYSRFVHYAHDLESFFSELQESSTIWMSRPELLPKFVLKTPPPALTLSSISDFIYFKAIQKLRKRPGQIVRPLTSNQVQESASTIRDIRDFRISSMDGYVLAREAPQAKAEYRSCVLKLFLADRVALGLMPLLELQLFALKVYLAWSLAPALANPLSQLSALATRSTFL
ncbi:Protein of unknown function (DUF1365) domain containing protein [Rhypophila sp. PSN 637]